MPGIIATVFHNGTDWEVKPSKIELDDANGMDHWDLSGVYSYPPWKGKIADVKIVFTDGPAVLDPQKGPFTAIPEFAGPERKLKGQPRNKKFGLYTYDIVVTLLDSLHQGIDLFPIDPQIDNVAPPPPPDGRGPDLKDPGRGGER